ncbi:hypothetical protein [Clostridium saccharoperbutylacetonicum]|uniref:hypothetical protein n=1 Tax=Clostridium saccharoperbutylacetonicum TaxID=36745 RepID=UPI0039EAF55B
MKKDVNQSTTPLKTEKLISIETTETSYDKSLVKSSPLEIPSTAKVAKQAKTGYKQIKYTWSDDVYKYEARWHTRTPGAPKAQGNTWVITRTTPGKATGQPKVQHIMTGENEWTTMNEWQKAVIARQNGVTTPEQQSLLDRGHWPAP